MIAIEIEEFLGRTPYGESYRARDMASGQLVAIKALNPALISDGATMERLTREVQVATQLDHKNIAATYGLFGAQVGADPVAYLACEYVDGQTLREMLEKKRAVGPRLLAQGRLQRHRAPVQRAGLRARRDRPRRADARLDHGQLGRAREGGRLRPGADAAAARQLPRAGGRRDDGGDAAGDDGLARGGRCARRHLLRRRHPVRAAHGAHAGRSFERAKRGGAGRAARASIRSSSSACSRRRDERYADAQALKEALHAALAADLAGPNAQAAAAIAMPPGRRRRKSRGKQPMPVVNTPTPPPKPRCRRAQAPTPPPRPHAPPVAASSAPPPHGAPQPRAAPPVAGRRPRARSRSTSTLRSPPSTTRTERWLIQKDKLDFGPFAMEEVRSQIEQGKILGEHVIIDTENGQRQHVRDHPQLRQLVLEAEARLDEEARLSKEANERSKFRGRMVTIFALVGVVLLAGGGFAFWYAKKHGAFETKVVKEVVHDGEYDFMKGVEISMKVDPPAAKPKRPS